jgi:hypothetical protein
MTTTIPIDRLETDYPDKLELKCSANLSTASNIGTLKNEKNEKKEASEKTEQKPVYQRFFV